jgi:nucleotide-binding universal stress UspA family protein
MSRKKAMPAAKKKGRAGGVVWAVDPLDLRVHRPMAQFLEGIVAGPIFPLALISPGLPFSLQGGAALELHRGAELAVVKSLDRIATPRLQPPEVRLVPNSSRRELVENVLDHAKRRRAEFVAVGTRSSSAMDLLRLGGFTEALVAKASLPVLAVHPRMKARAVRRILFPTDFSPESRKAFRKTLEIASRLKADLLLAHVEVSPVSAFAYVDAGVAFNPAWADAEAAAIRERHHLEARYWLREARSTRVRAEYASVRNSYSVAQTVLRIAGRKKVDLISLGSYREGIARTLLGSTVRDVLRSARIPVMVIHVS